MQWLRSITPLQSILTPFFVPFAAPARYDPDDGTPAKLFDGSRYGHLVGLVIGSCFMMCAPCLCFGCLTFIKAMKS